MPEFTLVVQRLYTDTPFGADCITCPKCSEFLYDRYNLKEDLCDVDDSIILNGYDLDSVCLDLPNNDWFIMCVKCWYIFDLCGTYEERGCTSSLYYYDFPTTYISSIDPEKINTIGELKQFMRDVKITEIDNSCNFKDKILKNKDVNKNAESLIKVCKYLYN